MKQSDHDMPRRKKGGKRMLAKKGEPDAKKGKGSDDRKGGKKMGRKGMVAAMSGGALPGGY